MPQRDSSKVHWAPNDVMLHYFEQLEDQPDRQDVRFVMALLMLRRRVVRLEETITDEQDQEVMVYYCPRNEKTYEVNSVMPEAARVDEIQQELAQLLFADAS